MRTALIALTLVVSSVAAQAPRNFSGEWVLQGGGGILGERFRATQDSKTIEFLITVPGLPKPVRAVYNLDGSESRNLNPPADEPIFSTVAWEGDRLIIRTRGTTLVNGKPTESKRVIWIDAEGLFNIERSSEGQPTTRSAYRRVEP